MNHYRPLPHKLTRIALLCLLLVPCLADSQAAAADASDITCNSLSVTISPDKNYYIFTATASGGDNDITGYTFNFGDKQTYTVNFAASSTQNRDTAVVTHVYRTAGKYAPTVQVNTKSNNKRSAVSSSNCQTGITIQPANNPLPSAGVRDTPQLFAVATLVGVVSCEIHLRRRAKHSYAP